MILIKQNGQVYEISFRYDPTIVQLIKQVPQKQWVSESKHWTIPVAHLGLFLNQLKGTMYEDQVKIESDEHLGEDQEIEHSTPIPRLDVSQLPLYVKKGGKLYDHQIDFMRWAIYREAFQQNFHGFILADQMGCISGDQEVWIKEKDKPATRPVKLSTFYKLWHSCVIRVCLPSGDGIRRLDKL